MSMPSELFFDFDESKPQKASKPATKAVAPSSTSKPNAPSSINKQKEPKPSKASNGKPEAKPSQPKKRKPRMFEGSSKLEAVAAPVIAVAAPYSEFQAEQKEKQSQKRALLETALENKEDEPKMNKRQKREGEEEMKDVEGEKKEGEEGEKKEEEEKEESGDGLKAKDRRRKKQLLNYLNLWSTDLANWTFKRNEDSICLHSLYRQAFLDKGMFKIALKYLNTMPASAVATRQKLLDYAQSLKESATKCQASTIALPEEEGVMIDTEFAKQRAKSVLKMIDAPVAKQGVANYVPVRRKRVAAETPEAAAEAASSSAAANKIVFEDD